MAYKILYVEDLDPSSIIHELSASGFDAKPYNPESLETLLKEVRGNDLLLLDFRLTENRKIPFDAPTIAQTIRTLGSESHLDIPVVLISTEDKICNYYDDYSSQDLFDFSLSKETLLNNLPKFSRRFNAAIEAYKFVIKSKMNALEELGLKENNIQSIDYRILEKLNSDMFQKDVFATTNFILNNIIKAIGVLLGEDVLSARLGISVKSPDWDKLKDKLSIFKYSGIYSSAYDRWWAFGIDGWWSEQNSNTSLRRLNAQQRVARIKEMTGLQNLIEVEKIHYSSSTNYWTICKDCKQPLDPIDGLELSQKYMYPWQEKEYISMDAGLKSSPLTKLVTPQDMKRLREFSKNI